MCNKNCNVLNYLGVPINIVTKDIITSDSIRFKLATLDYDSNCLLMI